MKIKLTALVLAFFVTGLGAACSKTDTANTGNANKTANANTANANSASTEKPTMKTPQGTFKVAYEAAKIRDLEAFKKTISKDYMDLLKGLADREKRKVDDIITEGLTKHPVPANPETRNVQEQEDGTLRMEFKDGNGQWLITYLIKEGDDWKFTFGPGSNLIEELSTGSGKEGSEGDVKNANEKKGRGNK
ncbi:MAG TPA: hypothetical protein VGC66_14140 [Pyrinomonadaceae bacterium]|jgi:hypothetical protein